MPKMQRSNPFCNDAASLSLPRINRSLWIRVAVGLLFVGLVANFQTRGARADSNVALDLVLAVDVSGSVSAERFELQKQGYVAAFRDSRVIRAIKTAAGGPIAVTMTQWTGPYMQIQVVPWMLVKDEATASQLAKALEAAPRQLFSGGTSISGAIDHAVKLLTDSPSKGVRRVIDLSGDGANNHGRPAAEARDAALAANIIINGLPILALDPNLEIYYRNNVIGGPGAFVIAARNYEAFAEAIVRKLVLEIAGSPASPEREKRAHVPVGDAPAGLESRLEEAHDLRLAAACGDCTWRR
jgi:Protein of unknown function (DUF1194)